MPKYNLDVVLTNLEGDQLITLADPKVNKDTGDVERGADGQPLPQERIPLTAANAIIKALTLDSQDNMSADAEKKASMYRIAKRIKEAVNAKEDVTLNAADIEVVKGAIGKLWGVMTVGCIDVILEG